MRNTTFFLPFKKILSVNREMKILYYILLLSLIFTEFPFNVPSRAENKWTSHEYTKEVVLPNASKSNGQHVAMAILEPAISSVGNISLSSAAINVRVYQKYSDLVVILSAWLNGTQHSVIKANSVVDRVIAEFGKVQSISTFHPLSHMFLEKTDFQHSMVEVYRPCDYQGNLDNLNSLTLCVLKTSIPIALRTKKAFLTPMQNVSMDSFSKQYPRTSIHFKSNYNVFRLKRSPMVGALVDYAANSTEPEGLKIPYGARGGSHDYHAHMALMDSPLPITDTSQCIGHFWYLIFFIVLVPISLCLSLVFYRCGLESGRRSIRESENDIRAGLRLSLSPWGPYAVPPRYPMQYPPGHGYNNVGMSTLNQMVPQSPLLQATTGSVYHQQIYGDGMMPQHQASWKPS